MNINYRLKMVNKYENQCFDPHELVYFKSGNEIESAGYKINSILMNQGIPAMVTDNHNSMIHNDKVSSALNNFAIPAGLLLINQKPIKHYTNEEDINEVVNDDLFEKLLKLSEPPMKKKKNTKRKKISNSKKTKRVVK